jgi:hypothetical protein
MVGLGGDDPDFSPKLRRRPSSAFRISINKPNPPGSPNVNKILSPHDKS